MSTAPNGWQNPKTNWTSSDAPRPSDFMRIEGDINAIETGNRTLDPAQAPTGNTGTLRQLLDWFANRIKGIMGTPNWWDAPPTTLLAAKAHIDRMDNPHNTTADQVGAFRYSDSRSNDVDLNTYTQQGVYALGGGLINGPIERCDWGVLFVGVSGDVITQLLMNHEQKIFYRGANGNPITWKPWVKLWHDGFIASFLQGSGYIKLPNGLILQWIKEVSFNPGTPIPFPITFPNNIFSAVATLASALTPTPRYISISNYTNSTITISSNDNQGSFANIIAIGN